ncbi:MAG: SIS domain-containing protein, partial [Bacillota bacterium]|nr:SIS domain-containing protein [Bacillota bacterium]
MSTQHCDIEASVKQAIRSERDAVDALLRYAGNDYAAVVEAILESDGRLIFFGVGKSGHIGKKLAATFASTGTPSFFVHATEALHGDLGMIRSDDIVCMISNSGTTREVLDALPTLQALGCKRIALTSDVDSPLAAGCDLSLTYPKPVESDHLNLAPTASSTVTLVLGD